MEINEQILSNMIRKGMGWVLALLEETDDKEIAMVITKHDGEKVYLRMKLEGREKLYDDEVLVYLRMKLEDREKLYDEVLNYFQHETEEASFEELKGKFKVEDIFLVDVLDKLKEDGEIYEPKNGIYRYL